MKKYLIKKYLIISGVILFILFIYFSYLVAKETFIKFDFDTTVRIQNKIPHKADLLFSFFSVLGSAEITGIIWFGLLIFLAIKKFWRSVLAFFLLPLALIMEIFGKLFVHHPSPPYLFYRGVLDVKFPLEFTHTDYSYPSGHETRTAFLIIFLMCYFLLRKDSKFQLFIQPILLFTLMIMTISRVSLGEHWTTDVIGGFLVGAGFGLIAGVTIPVKKLVTNNS